MDFELFLRKSGQYYLSPGAEKILEIAKEVEGRVDKLQQSIEGKTLRPQGILRVTVTDSVMFFVMTSILDQFQKLHPEIRLELNITNQILSLTRRDSDIAFRTGRTIPAHLIGHPIGEITFGIFASKKYLDEHKARDLNDHKWLGLDEPMLSGPPGQWVTKNIHEENIILRANSFVALQLLAEAGMGLTILPAAFAKRSRQLTQLPVVLDELTNGLWLVTHPQVNQSSRVKAFVDFMTQPEIVKKLFLPD